MVNQSARKCIPNLHSIVAKNYFKLERLPGIDIANDEASFCVQIFIAMKLKFLWVVIVLGNLFFLAHTTTAAQVMVFTANTYAVGVNPMSVAVGDFNGDGKMDLVTANYGNASGNTLTLLTNNGGSFVFNATLVVGMPLHPPGANQSPYGVTVADVNQDSKPDLISANYGNSAGNTLTVLTNNGTGIFSSNATLTVGNGPRCVVFADVNGDGQPDLISANYTAGTLTILTNSGIGTFGFNATLSAASKSGFVAAADLNGDSKLDLVCACADLSISRLIVFTNSSSGMFGSNATLSLLGQCQQVVAADVNGDNQMDLVATAYAGLTNEPALVIFTNNGAGKFNSSIRITLSGNALSLVVADMNGDGKMDLISANGDNRLTVLTNDGLGNFGLSSQPYVGSFPNSIVATEINSDSKPDFITANNLDSTVTVLTQTNVGLPYLGIATILNGVRLAWQSPATGFVLQTNSNLMTTNWAAAFYRISSSNSISQSSAVTSLPPDKLFFRFKP